LATVLENKSPTSAADVQAIVIDSIEVLQQRIRGDSPNSVDLFYDDRGVPLSENMCRDRMLALLGADLPFGISWSPEVAMPRGTRSDAGFTLGGITVPLEAKGQWHKDVWTAAASQLDALYMRDHRCGTKGIYIIFWFGRGAPAGKRLKGHPDKFEAPETAQQMKDMLLAGLPADRKSDIEIIVLDLTK
jgi:hypothetical protein